MPDAEVPSAVWVTFPGTAAGARDAELAEALDDLLVAELERLGTVRVRLEAETARVADDYAERLARGCPEEGCAGELMEFVKSLTTPYLLVARLSRIGRTRVLKVSLLRTADGEALARATFETQRESRLTRGVTRVSLSLLKQAGLRRETLGPAGHPWPRFQLTLKVGNGISRLVEAPSAQSLLGLRLDAEGNFYVRRGVLVFVVISTSLGGRTEGSDAVRLQFVPLVVGAKRLWTFSRARAWAGAGVGPGLLGVVLPGQSRDLRAAFAVTAVAGADWRWHRRWAVGVEVSTSLTDAILAQADEVGVPIVAGATLGLGYFFF